MNKPSTTTPFIELGQAVIREEAQAIAELEKRISTSFSEACQYILNCKGKIIVLGMGKSGHIGKKIAATLASTGTPAFFIHPGEASHGDMGMITSDDVLIGLSHSGETPELLAILPFLKRKKIPLITISGNTRSTLVQHSNAHLDTAITKEACPLGLAPTTSTTTMLVMGDALAIALLEARGFNEDDFALYHPAGALGKRLLLLTQDIMHSGNDIPIVKLGTLLKDALIEISQKKLGMAIIIDENDNLQGIFTDGDLRRAIDNNHDIYHTTIDKVMSTNCSTITPSTLAIDALNIMQDKKITSLIVKSPEDNPVGIVHMHDLLKAGVT